MSAHTPKPWHTGSLTSFNAATGEREVFVYRLQPGKNDAETADNRIRVRDVGNGRVVADGNLIAAAPAMYDALQLILRTPRCPRRVTEAVVAVLELVDPSPPALSSSRAAAKARGGK